MKLFIILIIGLMMNVSVQSKDEIITEKVISKSIMIPASPEEIWQKWTTEDGVKSFFASECEIEMKPGGKYEIYFVPDAEYGQKGSEGCKVLSFLPNKYFSFTWNAPPNFPEIRKEGDNTWVIIQLTAAQNATKVDLYHYGWREGEEWNNVYRYFDSTWSKVLQWLNNSFINDY
jgi:uncharacterized protein YndB with AHSA1/START domain